MPIKSQQKVIYILENILFLAQTKKKSKTKTYEYKERYYDDQFLDDTKIFKILDKQSLSSVEILCPKFRELSQDEFTELNPPHQFQISAAEQEELHTILKYHQIKEKEEIFRRMEVHCPNKIQKIASPGKSPGSISSVKSESTDGNIMV